MARRRNSDQPAKDLAGMDGFQVFLRVQRGRWVAKLEGLERRAVQRRRETEDGWVDRLPVSNEGRICRKPGLDEIERAWR